MSDRLYGTLQTPMKPLWYTGVDTDTIDILINQDDRTISAKIRPEITDQIKSNINNILAAKEKLSALSKELSDLQMSVASMYAELSSDIEILNKDISVLESEIGSELDRLTTKIESVETYLNKHVDSNTDQFNDINTKFEEIETTLDTLSIPKKVTDLEDFRNYVTYEELQDNYLDANSINNIYAQKGDSLADYGITDAYTKAEVEAKIVEIVTSGEVTLDEYVTEAELEDALKNVTVDLSAYATKDELNILENNIGYVATDDRSFAEVIDDTFAKKVEVPVTVAQLSDSSDYATKAFVEEQIKSIPVPEVDTENYFTKAETINAIEIVIDGINTVGPDMSKFFDNLNNNTL